MDYYENEHDHDYADHDRDGDRPDTASCEICDDSFSPEDSGFLHFCSEDCAAEAEDNGADARANWEDDDDRIAFADPGGRSALRAASRDNPRDLPCPTCGEPNRLTPADRAQGYQCDRCADQAERGGY